MPTARYIDKLPSWADGPQDAALYRKQLIKIVHEKLMRSGDDLVFFLSAYENIEYVDILDYISILPEEAVNEIIRKFAEGIPDGGS